MSTQVKVSAIPDCDVCKSELSQQVPAYADAKLNIGPWANVCRKHFQQYGCSLGTGRGQELVLRTESQDQDERIRENLRGIDWDTMTLDDFDELFEDRDPFEFM